jgi:hypothetical protein
MKVKVIAHVGFSGAGKTYASDVLEQKLKENKNNTVYRYSFINPVKKIIFNLFKLQENEYSDFKNTIYDLHGYKITGREIINCWINALEEISPFFLEEQFKNFVLKVKQKHQFCKEQKKQVIVIIDDLRRFKHIRFLKKFCRVYLNNSANKIVYCNYENKILENINKEILPEYEELAYYLLPFNFQHGQEIQGEPELTAEALALYCKNNNISLNIAD